MIVALLLVLWLPLLVFSSGAPTNQTPTILSIRVNASLTQVWDSRGRCEKIYRKLYVPLVTRGCSITEHQRATSEHRQDVSNPLDGSETSLSFPLYSGGARRSIQNWADPSSENLKMMRTGSDSLLEQGWGGAPLGQQDNPLPPGLSSYSKDQVKLFCLAQVGGRAGLCA